ncbi:unnamed protein product [Rotaria socialis]|nr:unnamed protein product [Rotaria socialis]CAF4517846.1 unnamed protein product [Rotaria socialis]CAF4751838.1 unnamed protein product [Rotaria socialis]
MPNKSNRWGYKMFLLAGGRSGICYDFIFFYTDIATVLLKMSPPLPPPIKRGRSSLQLLQVKSNEKNSTITARTASSPAPSSSVRFDKFDHWPTPTSKGRCRIRGCTGYTRISCSKCELRLCLNNKNNCYTDYHS